MHRAPLAALATLLALGACDRTAPTELRPAAVKVPPAPSQTVIASGLLYPRGIAFHDGAI